MVDDPLQSADVRAVDGPGHAGLPAKAPRRLHRRRGKHGANPAERLRSSARSLRRLRAANRRCGLRRKRSRRSVRRRWDVMPLALADFAGPVKLRRRAGGAGDVAPASASMVEGFRSPGFYDNEVWVFAAIGDSVVPPLSRGPVAAIKIDTEGAELEVVKGLSATIAKYRPPIFFEVLNHFLIVSKQALDDKTIIFREQRVKDLELRLRRMDYEICRILSSGRVERVDRIEPRRVRNQRETMFVAVQKADVALHGLLGLPS